MPWPLRPIGPEGVTLSRISASVADQTHLRRPFLMLKKTRGIPAITMPVPSMSRGWPQQKANFKPTPATGTNAASQTR